MRYRTIYKTVGDAPNNTAQEVLDTFTITINNPCKDDTLTLTNQRFTTGDAADSYAGATLTLTALNAYTHTSSEAVVC